MRRPAEPVRNRREPATDGEKTRRAANGHRLRLSAGGKWSQSLREPCPGPAATGPAYSIAENDTSLEAGARNILGDFSLLLGQAQRTVLPMGKRPHAPRPGHSSPRQQSAPALCAGRWKEMIGIRRADPRDGIPEHTRRPAAPVGPRRVDRPGDFDTTAIPAVPVPTAVRPEDPPAADRQRLPG